MYTEAEAAMLRGGMGSLVGQGVDMLRGLKGYQAFPSIQPEHEWNFWGVYHNGKPTQPETMAARDQTYYHKVAIAANQQQIDFFNAGVAEYVTNLDNGKVEAGRPMWIEWIGFRLVEVDAAGALTTNYSKDDAAATTSITNAIALAKSLSAAVVRAQMGNRVVFEDIGADRFPVGGGVDLQAAAFSGATGLTVGHAVSNVNLGGAPVGFNIRKLRNPIALTADKPIRVSLKLQGQTIPAACSLVAMLGGTEVSASQYR